MAVAADNNPTPCCPKCGNRDSAPLIYSAIAPAAKMLAESAAASWKQVDTTARALVLAFINLTYTYACFRLVGLRLAVVVWLATQTLQAYQFHHRLSRPIIANSHLLLIAATLIALAILPNSETWNRCFVNQPLDGSCAIPILFSALGTPVVISIVLYAAMLYCFTVLEPALTWLTEPLFRERRVPAECTKID